MISLDGTWLFYPGELAEDFPATSGELLKVPEIWNTHIRKSTGRPMGADGFGTYILELRVPPDSPPLGLKIPALGAAYRLYINGKWEADGGVVGMTAAEEVPQYRPRILPLEPGQSSYRLALQVSNHHHVEGGLWYSVKVGNLEVLEAEDRRAAWRDFFLLGSLVIMGFYHLGLFGFLRKDFSPLFFGVLCLILSLRIPLYGEYMILQFLPDLSFEIHQKLGFLTFYLAPSLFFHFIRALYPLEMPKVFPPILDGITALFILTVAVFPYKIYGVLLPGFQMAAVAAGVVILVVLSRALGRRRIGSALFLGGFLILFGAMINDILYANLLVQTGHLFPWGLLTFIFVQSMVLTRKFADAFHAVDALNTSFKRFVPMEFLERLERSSITEVQLGDHTEARMAVLFSDIRSFTELSERMTPEENFRFINEFLERMGPQIRRHGGFVDKYLGDGIMALFPGGGEAAVKAALDMITALGEYNRRRKAAGKPPVRIGIGLHRGLLMMGTIGERERMDSTVIADAVNLSSRLEALTKVYQCDLIATLEVLSDLPETYAPAHRSLGTVSIQGKGLPLPVFEIFEGDPPEVKEGKLATRDEFHRAMEALADQNIPRAVAILSAIHHRCPEDGVTAALIHQLQGSAPLEGAGSKVKLFTP